MAVLGHDLRNPLSAMVTSAHVLQHASDESLVQKTAARILSSGKRMSRMIEDMLDLARARLAGGIVLKREPADLGVLVDRVVQEYSTAIPDRRVEVVRTGDLSGEWDADRLAQVASNLISNAHQHGEAGPIHVELDGSHVGTVRLSVSNAGSIPPEVRPHIFDPFRGGQREVGRGEGLGLGLYIVQQIVQAHNGSIDISSSGGHTIFNVRVPRTLVSVIRL
jgi:signal transduction histidine kinase